ncbi:hypothetical protein [Haloferax sp. YSMS24]|uniref:hypothetical protein n=1 Tax=unclassified Haloferax TaxID=2625095 RepID=UPI00398D5F06
MEIKNPREMTPLMTHYSHISALGTEASVEEYETLSDCLIRVEKVLNEIIYPLLEENDSRVEVLNRGLGRVGVCIDEELAKLVWSRSGVLAGEMQRAVAKAHQTEMKTFVNYGFRRSKGHGFLIKDASAEYWDEPFAPKV